MFTINSFGWHEEVVIPYCLLMLTIVSLRDALKVLENAYGVSNATLPLR